MNKCPFCNIEYTQIDNEKVMELGKLLSKKDNSELVKIYPHVFMQCPKCFMIDGEYRSEDLAIIKTKLKDLKEIMSQDFGKIDQENFAKVAECKGYICETIGDIIGATLGYKACLDIIEVEIQDFEAKYLKNVETKEESAKVLVDEDLELYENALFYRDSMRKLVASTASKSFEKLGYLGILIHLDTIINFDDFLLPDKIFALLNDKTTKLPDSLIKAKEQIEDKYLIKRKK